MAVSVSFELNNEDLSQFEIYKNIEESKPHLVNIIPMIAFGLLSLISAFVKYVLKGNDIFYTVMIIGLCIEMALIISYKQIYKYSLMLKYRYGKDHNRIGE